MLTIICDSGNIVSISGNIFLYPPQGHPILYNYFDCPSLQYPHVSVNDYRKFKYKTISYKGRHSYMLCEITAVTKAVTSWPGSPHTYMFLHKRY